MSSFSYGAHLSPSETPQIESDASELTEVVFGKQDHHYEIPEPGDSLAPVIDLDAVATAQALAIEDLQKAPTAVVKVQGVLAPAKDGKTVFPKGWSLVGDVESDCPVEVGARVQGNLSMTSSAAIEILHGASVKGVITAKEIIVRGDFDGELDATNGTVDIKEGAKITGRLCYSHIRMEGGAHKMELVYVPPVDQGHAA